MLQVSIIFGWQKSSDLCQPIAVAKTNEAQTACPKYPNNDYNNVVLITIII